MRKIALASRADCFASLAARLAASICFGLLSLTAHAACLQLAGSTSGNVAQLCSQTTSAPWSLTAPATGGTTNYLPYNLDGNGLLGWTNAPTILGTNITGIPTSVVSGQVSVAHGGTGGATGADAAANLGVRYAACTPVGIGTQLTTANETVIGYCTIPANMLGTTGAVRFSAQAAPFASANAKTLTLRLTNTAPSVGQTDMTGTTICGNAAMNGSNASTIYNMTYGFVLALGDTSHQGCHNFDSIFLQTNHASITTYDSTQPLYILVNATLSTTGGSEAITLRSLGAWLLPASGGL